MAERAGLDALSKRLDALHKSWRSIEPRARPTRGTRGSRSWRRRSRRLHLIHERADMLESQLAALSSAPPSAALAELANAVGEWRRISTDTDTDKRRISMRSCLDDVPVMRAALAVVDAMGAPAPAGDPTTSMHPDTTGSLAPSAAGDTTQKPTTPAECAATARGRSPRLPRRRRSASTLAPCPRATIRTRTPSTTRRSASAVVPGACRNGATSRARRGLRQ